MNAVTLFNHNINLNIQQHSFFFPPAANPKWPRASSSSIRRRNPSSGTRPSSSSLVVEVESKAVSDSEQTPPPSVTRRLILLRHANSSWVDPSLKGRLGFSNIFLCFHYILPREKLFYLFIELLYEND